MTVLGENTAERGQGGAVVRQPQMWGILGSPLGWVILFTQTLVLLT